MSKKVLLVVVLVLGVIAIPVASIIGGALFATTQEPCTQTTSGFSGGDIYFLIEDFGLDSRGNLVMEVRSGAQSNVELQSVTVDGQTEQLSNTIGVGSSTTVTVSQIDLETSESCSDLPVELNYSSGGSQDSVNGTLTGEFQVE